MNPISAVMGAMKYMPASIARKALEKVNPKFGNFFSKAVAYGFDTDKLIEGLSNKFKGESQKDYENQLSKGESDQTLRPDEMASRSQMENRAIPEKAIKSGIALAAGGSLAGRESPQAVQEQPQQPNPQQPSPMSGAAMGQDVQAQQASQNQSAGANDMMQDDFSDILNHIKNRMAHGGRSLEQAAQEVGGHKQFKDRVMKIEKSGVKFTDWVKQQLGGQQGQGKGQSQGQQSSSGVDQAIMAAFEKIMSL